jgi:Spy/CpxP family protein refolding chaperone
MNCGASAPAPGAAACDFSGVFSLFAVLPTQDTLPELRTLRTTLKEKPMRLTRVFTLSAVALLGVAATMLAQQPGQRGPGGPGRGGFGFGGFGGFTSRMSLLRIPEVRKELELADEQIAELDKFRDEMRAKYPFPGRGGPGGPGGRPDGQRGGKNPNTDALNAPPADWYFVQAQEQPGQGRGGRGGFQMTDEQRAQFEKQQAEQAREERAKLADVLLPNQLKRLNEIYVQQAGPNALFDEDIAKELSITDAQKTKLTATRTANQESMGAQIREIFQGGGDRDANRAKIEEIRKANDAKLLAVLTPEQQTKFEQMKGKPFAMPENAGRGGPPGGFGGRRGGNRGGNNNNN